MNVSYINGSRLNEQNVMHNLDDLKIRTILLMLKI